MESRISILLCSRNRGAALQRCLEALDQAAIKRVGAELILVDNGSTDGSLAVMQSFAEKVPCPVQVVSEPRPGLSFARNTALHHASGATLVFLDDDCYLAEGYLDLVSKKFPNTEYAFAGGRILNHDPTDSEYGSNRQEMFECIPAGSFIPPGKFQGTNFVLDRKVVEAIGGFDTDLGAGTPFRCEDIDFCARASLAGFAGAHDPELLVYHHHGRKPGEQRHAIARANAIAGGAYYLKFFFSGHPHYLTGWFSTFRLTHKKIFLWEIWGALQYALWRFARLFRRHHPPTAPPLSTSRPPAGKEIRSNGHAC